MKYLLYLFQIIIIQYTGAHVMTLGGNNYVPKMNNVANMPVAANLANGLDIGNGIALATIGQSGVPGLNTPQGVNSNILSNNLGNIEFVGTNVENVAYGKTGNMPTLASYANIVQPPREYGIEFAADALEMAGQVAVSGRMPFSANVAMKGSVPAQGQGSISYKCDDS